PNDAKMKSCARPTCIPLEETTKECPVLPAANSGPREPIVLKPAGAPKEEATAVDEKESIGKVKVIQGSGSIVHADGKRDSVTKEADLKENETVESGGDGGAVVNFKGGKKLHVHSDTTVQVKEYKDSQVEDPRKALLNLIKGKIRNQVE